MDSIFNLCNEIIQKHHDHVAPTVFTVAVSGIDASGKGHISKLLQEELENCGYNVANINVDPWQNPLPVRLKKEHAAKNFYDNVFRWDDFFNQLIIPLQQNGEILLDTKGIRSDADVYYPILYDYRNLDIILVEGILLLQKKFLSLFDYKIWIDCSFETGLQRAIQRNVEKLDEERLKKDYEMYYYAAQRLHLERDVPRQYADSIFNNDPLLLEVPPSAA